MAYTNRTIRIRFDGTQVNPNDHVTEPGPDGKPIPVIGEDGLPLPVYYPNLGDDVWILVRNPMLMPQSLLVPKTDVAVDDNGRPLDVHAALAASREVVASFIADWHVYDSFDLSDEPQPLPVPATAEMMDRVPGAIGDAVGELIQRARNPR